MERKSFAINLAKKAGEIMRDNFTLGMKKEWKSDNTPVTETDIRINNLVLNAVKKSFPSYSIIAEEGSNMLENSEFVWVCDPVDGTIPFSLGIPTCVFSLALLRHGEPILGVVYDPFMDRMFTAEKGKGAFLNNNKIEVSKNAGFDRSVIAFHFGKKGIVDSFNFGKELVERKVKIMYHHSIIYASVLVAAGELVAAIHNGNHPWDSASSAIIVKEAGGKATDLFGNEQRYDQDIKGCLLTNGKVHDSLLNMIKKNN